MNVTTTRPTAAVASPKSPPGRAPIGHALRPDDDVDAIAARLSDWRLHFRIDSTETLWLLEGMVIESLRVDRCRARAEALLREEAARAARCWDEDRRDEAQILAGKLSRRPALVSRLIQQTRQGAELMIELWRDLGAKFDRQGEWSKEQKALAHDLLGTRKELRDDAPFADPVALVAGEVARLERRKAQSLDRLDAMQHQAAERGHAPIPSKALKDLRREEAACLRNYRDFAGPLRAARLAVPSPEPAPKAPPLPEPAVKPEPGAPASTAMPAAKPDRAGGEAAPAAPPAPADGVRGAAPKTKAVFVDIWAGSRGSEGPGRRPEGNPASGASEAARRGPVHSGSGFPLVSGAKGNASRPITKTAHIVTPA